MAETAHFNYLYEEEYENVLLKENGDVYVTPQWVAGVFLEGCCPPGHHKCSLAWHCKLVLYTAVTEQSW